MGYPNYRDSIHVTSFFIKTNNATPIEINIFNSQDAWTSLYYGDLQLILGVVQLPRLGVPYPLTNGGQQLRHASGRCPDYHPSVTYILKCLVFACQVFRYPLCLFQGQTALNTISYFCELKTCFNWKLK